MMVSLFPQIKATTGGQRLPLGEVLAGIRAGQWATQVKAVRAEQPGSPAYDEAKRALPYFTPSGTFERRAVGGLVEHSGFMSLDLDAKPNPDTDWAQVRAAIEADEHTYAVFTSTAAPVKMHPSEIALTLSADVLRVPITVTVRLNQGKLYPVTL